MAEYQGALLVVSHDLEFLARIGVEWALQLPSARLLRIAEPEGTLVPATPSASGKGGRR